MALQLRHILRACTSVNATLAEQLAVRQISVCTPRLSGKQKESKTETKTPPPPKPSASTPTPPVSTGDSYQVPEYYGFNEMSYYDLESSMAKQRLPQPTPGTPA